MTYKHRLRKRIFQNGHYRHVIVHTNSNLGSDVLDKNGKEIFEGDFVLFHDRKYPVLFQNGALCIAGIPLTNLSSPDLEVVDIVGND